MAEANLRVVPKMQPAPSVAAPAVIVRCGLHVFALDSRHVQRMLLVDEIEAASRTPGVGELVRIRGAWHFSANLGELFGAKTPSRALVLANPAGRTDLSVAIHVGSCLKVAPMPALTRVPPGLVRTRASAIAGAFAASSVRGGVAGALVGLAIDLDRLWSERELTAIARLIASAAEDDGWGAP